MEAERFNSVYAALKYGLIRLDGNGILVDKNEMAEALLPLPRRGSNVLSLILGERKLDELGAAAGSAAAIIIESDGVRRIAVAFRESRGTALLLLHPLLSTLHFGHNGAHFKRILSYYSKNILLSLEAAGGNSYFCVNPLPDKSFFGTFNLNSYYVLKNAVYRTVNKLEQTELKKELTVVVKNPPRDGRLGVVLSQVEFALSELLTVRELYGEEKVATLNISYNESCLIFVLRDKIAQNGVADECYFRIFSEMMKLIDVGSCVHISDVGELTLEVYVPFVKVNSLADTMAHTEWSYFDYVRAYYSLLK